MLVIGAGATVLGAPGIGRAQAAWPLGRPIRVICPTPPGAANDMLARLLAQRVNKHRSGPPYEFCISSCKRLRNFIWGEVPIRTPFERHISNPSQ